LLFLSKQEKCSPKFGCCTSKKKRSPEFVVVRVRKSARPNLLVLLFAGWQNEKKSLTPLCLQNGKPIVRVGDVNAFIFGFLISVSPPTRILELANERQSNTPTA